jgi:arabinofuranan 3-O-arabinosyltransferase
VVTPLPVDDSVSRDSGAGAEQPGAHAAWHAVLRWVHPLVWLLILFYSMIQRPGQTTFDTKLDLTVAPGDFLMRSTHLWNPQANFGEIQNQAYGYAFPQGPFFVLGELLHIAPWIVQRLWSALLLLLAYEGARRLWRAVANDRRLLPGLAAGLAYAFAPRLIGLDGVLTGEVLPTAMLPWLLLPLVHGARGRLSPRTAGLLSAVALLCCGGLNAVENIAILPLPLFVVLAGLRLHRGLERFGWWMIGTILASLWWILPLFVMGAYSPNFLNYIETSAATTGMLGWFNVTRGANHWVGFFISGDSPLWPASWTLSVTDTGVAITLLAVIPMVWGLFDRRMPERKVWVSSFLLGAACLVVAHVSPVGSPLAETMRNLLDGPLAPFRNVHKVDPLMRLPLAMGAAHVVTLLLVPVRGEGRRRWVAGTALVASFGLLVAGALPLFQGDMRRPGWREIPEAWHAAADYVEQHRDGGRVLILPGSGFGNQTWGATVDEPMQAVSRAPWVSRSQVPLAPGQTIRMLDAIEDRVSQGVGSPVLGDILSRAGISMVIVRRDLDPGATDAPAPNRVDMAISSSGGLKRAAGFGTTSIGGLPLVEVFEVDADVSMLDVTPLDTWKVVASDPADVMAALEAELIDRETGVLFAKDMPATPPDVQGDGLRLVQREFSRVHDSTSGVMGPEDPITTGNNARDYDAVPGEKAAYLDSGDVRSVTASSTTGDAEHAASTVQATGPYGALDDDLTTAWVTSRYSDADKAWLRLRLKRRHPLDMLTLRFATTNEFASVREVEIRTDRQRLRVPVNPDNGLASVVFDGGPTESIQVTVTKVAAGFGSMVALRELWANGVDSQQKVVVPDRGADSWTSFVFNNRPPRGACTPSLGGPVCDLSSIRTGDSGPLTREFTLREDSEFVLQGMAQAQRLPATASLLASLTDEQVTISSESVYADDPLVLPQFAYDRDAGTAWMGEPGDRTPGLSLTWTGDKTLRKITVLPASGAAAPTHVTLTAGDEVRNVPLTGFMADGRFPPLRTDFVDITFSRPGADLGDAAIGVAELRIQGLNKKRLSSFNPDLATGSVCGFGPEVRIDDRVIPTRVTGTLGELVSGAPLSYESCDDEEALSLGWGTHDLEVTGTGQFQPVSANLISTRERATTRVRARTHSVESWNETRREVRVGGGPESVLRIPENANRGWVATLDGKPLRKVSPDGWQQGYVVPAGKGGLVQLTFTPDRAYRLVLGGGLLAGLLVMLLAAWSVLVDRRRGQLMPVVAWDGPRPDGDRPARWWWFVLAAPVSGLLGGLGPLLGVGLGILLRRWWPVVVSVLLLAALGVRLGDVPDWVPRWSPDLAAGAAIGVLICGWLLTWSKEDVDG